jgi:hypothetical protein
LKFEHCLNNTRVMVMFVLVFQLECLKIIKPSWGCKLKEL